MKDKQAVKPKLLENNTAAKVTQQLTDNTLEQHRKESGKG